jgi:hypothetical protein
MTIRIHPPSLEVALSMPFAARRLRNREAKIEVDGVVLQEGSVVEMLVIAKLLNTTNPQATIWLIETCCGNGLA